MNNIQLNNTHPLIKNTNSYGLFRKLLTIHANDRDTQYYPLSNEFSIKCPEPYTNIQSLRINEINFPSSVYNFSNYLQNNKFIITLTGHDPLLITIPDGFYSPSELAISMKHIINDAVTAIPITPSFEIIVIKPEQKFLITSNISFCLSEYNIHECINNNFLYKYKAPVNSDKAPIYPLNLGFLYYLGFNLDISNIKCSFDMSYSEFWKEPKNGETYTVKTGQVVKSDVGHRFRDTQPIYMELKKWSIYDELSPYSKNSNNLYNNYNNSSINTAILKILPRMTDNVLKNYSEILDSNNAILFFETPIERVNTFGFKFRYHDGQLIDLQTQDINFTLEINQLRNEIPTKYNVKTNIGLY